MAFLISSVPFSYVPNPSFAAVVAVKPGQEKPLKIAVVVQSEPANYWLIKVSQIGCAEITPFKGKAPRLFIVVAMGREVFVVTHVLGVCVYAALYSSPRGLVYRKTATRRSFFPYSVNRAF